MAASSLRRWALLAGSLSAVFLAAVLSFADDEEEAKPNDNPYLPREGLSAEELREFIDRMQRSPKTVQLQPGFTEAIGVAVDRLLAAKPTDELRAFGLSSKMQTLHLKAMHNDEAAQKKLMALVKESKDVKDKELAAAVEFYSLEDRALDAGLNAKTEDLPTTLEELKKFFAGQPELNQRHLRLASATVKIINRVSDDELAQKSYKEFGELWAKSQELDLKRYGQRIAKGTRKRTPEIVGKPMPISGTTHDNKPFDVAAYRGKPVVVIFWATWCGPCRALMPEFKAIYEHFHADGLEIVGVSKDEDRDALAAYIEAEKIAWPNLFDTDSANAESHPISEKYGVFGIPTMFLLDREGKVVAKDLHGQALADKVEELIDGKSAASKPSDAKPAEGKETDKKEKAVEKPADKPDERSPSKTTVNSNGLGGSAHKRL
jgi:thiol-disulfide isomerase/thioredoxin